MVGASGSRRFMSSNCFLGSSALWFFTTTIFFFQISSRSWARAASSMLFRSRPVTTAPNWKFSARRRRQDCGTHVGFLVWAMAQRLNFEGSWCNGTHCSCREATMKQSSVQCDRRGNMSTRGEIRSINDCSSGLSAGDSVESYTAEANTWAIKVSKISVGKMSS
ncbi:hypothetical protein IWX50DRAFT_300702 [Phyllosticta citricarpa]